jgi:starch phosphorylase
VHWGNLTVSAEKEGWVFEVQIYLGEILPESVQIQLYAESAGEGVPVCEAMQRHASIPGALNGYLYRSHLRVTRPHTDFTPRCVAYHADACIPIENNLIQWWSGTATLSRNSP